MVNVEKIRATQAADLATIAETTADICLVIDRALTIVNGTIPLPQNPIDGQIFMITTRTAITNLTLNTNGITIYGGIVSLTANTRVGWIFDQASAAWFPY